MMIYQIEEILGVLDVWEKERKREKRIHGGMRAELIEGDILARIQHTTAYSIQHTIMILRVINNNIPHSAYLLTYYTLVRYLRAYIENRLRQFGH